MVRIGLILYLFVGFSGVSNAGVGAGDSSVQTSEEAVIFHQRGDGVTAPDVDYAIVGPEASEQILDRVPEIKEAVERQKMAFSLEFLLTPEYRNQEFLNDTRRLWKWNLVIAVIRAGISGGVYMRAVPHTSDLRILGATLSLLGSNLRWAWPGSWNAMQLRRQQNLRYVSMTVQNAYYRWRGVDFVVKEGLKKATINWPTRMAVNLGYGLGVSAWTGYLANTSATSASTFWFAILPNALWDEALNHWTKFVDNENPRAFISPRVNMWITAVRHLMYAYIISKVQTGNEIAEITSATIGVASFLAFWKMPELVDWTRPVWGPLWKGGRYVVRRVDDFHFEHFSNRQPLLQLHLTCKRTLTGPTSRLGSPPPHAID